MKMFTCLLLSTTLVVSVYGRATGIEGQDASRPPVFYAVGAPSCHSGNMNCILPDYDDPAAFYQCVSGCHVAVKQYCASCLHFDFWQQRCEWPGQEGAHPPAPALCSMLPNPPSSTQGPTTTRSTTTTSEGPSSSVDPTVTDSTTTPEEISSTTTPEDTSTASTGSTDAPTEITNTETEPTDPSTTAPPPSVIPTAPTPPPTAPTVGPSDSP